MIDRDASISDAAFREALDALEKEIALRHQFPYGSKMEYESTRARVLALYAEAQRQGERDQLALAEQVAEATMRMEQGRAERQGEVYEVEGEIARAWVRVPFLPGDKVRVTKVEEE